MSIVVEKVRKRKYCGQTEFQRRDGRNDRLKLEFEGYLKKEDKKKRTMIKTLG